MGTDVGTDSSSRPKTGTRLCIRMLWAAAAVVAGLVFGGITVLRPFLTRISTLLPTFLYVLALAAFALLLVGVWALATARPSSSSILSRALRKVIIRFLVPSAILIGRALGISRDRLISSFIQINNRLTMSRRFSLRPDEVLVLLPQCLQALDCNFRLTNDIHNCQRCGKCDVARLLDIFDRYGLDACVVPGGTLARELVKSKKPRVVLAIACERELSSGIADTHPTPVVSIINERPNGPCVATRASCESVDEILMRLLGESRCANDTKLVSSLRQSEGESQRESEGIESAN